MVVKLFAHLAGEQADPFDKSVNRQRCIGQSSLRVTDDHARAKNRRVHLFIGTASHEMLCDALGALIWIIEFSINGMEYLVHISNPP